MSIETIKQEPVAYLQIGISVLHKGIDLVRKDMPKVWNRNWWRYWRVQYD